MNWLVGWLVFFYLDLSVRGGRKIGKFGNFVDGIVCVVVVSLRARCAKKSGRKEDGKR